MNCKICNNATAKIFSKNILQKYPVAFYQCSTCQFIQTDEPFWLDEAYGSAITELDIGLVSRNLLWTPIVEKIVKNNFTKNAKFLDYGGGYGLFVRLMRDKGLDFYRMDIYCNNTFARHFDITDLPPNKKFELVTAFEVFEHLSNPLEEIQKMFQHSSSILFSTELQPSPFKQKIQKTTLENWHYLIPETGQHIALYHYETLVFIAKKFNKNLYSDGQYLHFLTDKKLSGFYFTFLKYKRYAEAGLKLIKNKLAIRPNSLLASDYAFLKEKISQ
jgi:Methyltransferase domain